MEIVRMILIISIIVVVVFAIVSIIIIYFKIKKQRKIIALEQNKIIQEIRNKKGEQSIINRSDFGEPIKEIKNILTDSINHEIVEFCVNSCIRNDYKEVLLIGNVEPYETITISNKANTKVLVKSDDFDFDKYTQIKPFINSIKYDLSIVDKLEEEEIIDAIMVLNSVNDFEKLFMENNKYLKKNGMFIIANTKSNKKSIKILIKELEKLNYRYDLLNWYTGFLVIVKR